ncbi:hypothetical protein [Streptomyces sp. NPDC001970]
MDFEIPEPAPLSTTSSAPGRQMVVFFGHHRWLCHGAEVAFEDGLGDRGAVPESEEFVGEGHDRRRACAGRGNASRPDDFDSRHFVTADRRGGPGRVDAAAYASAARTSSFAAREIPALRTFWVTCRASGDMRYVE